MHTGRSKGENRQQIAFGLSGHRCGAIEYLLIQVGFHLSALLHTLKTENMSSIHTSFSSRSHILEKHFYHVSSRKCSTLHCYLWGAEMLPGKHYAGIDSFHQQLFVVKWRNGVGTLDVGFGGPVLNDTLDVVL